MQIFSEVRCPLLIVSPSEALVARQIEAHEEDILSQCFRLRYDYFVRQRGWVALESAPDEERDHYDDRALHLAVFSGEEVRAYLRILPHDPVLGFMLDHDFAALLSEQERNELPRAGAIEISRLVCRFGKAESDGVHPLQLLLRLLHQVSVEQGFERSYIVVEHSWLRPFIRRFGVPFQVVGQPHTFAGGTRTVAATATLAELKRAIEDYSVSASSGDSP